MLLKREKFSSSDGIPDLAGAIVAARDKLVTSLVERAIGERQQVGPQDFEQLETLLLIFFELFDQFWGGVTGKEAYCI